MDLQARVSDWIDQRHRSVAIVLAVIVGITGSIALEGFEVIGSERPADQLAHVLVWGSAIAVAFYRTKPLIGLVAALGFVLTQWVLDYPADTGHGLWITFYAATRHGGHDRKRVWKFAVAGLAAVTIVTVVGVIAEVEDLPALAIIAIPLLYGTSTVIGEALYQRSRYVEQLEHRAIALEADLKNQAALAAVEERTRIAREMHDIIAHGMSTVVVQAQAGQRVLDSNPDKAREVLATIEGIGRNSVDEMRRMLGVLRKGEDESELVPQPGFADFNELRSQLEVAGVDLDLVVTGTIDSLTPGIELTCYRIVQEALTNTLRHAGRPVKVTANVSCGDREITIDISDDGLGAAALDGTAGTGHGLRGMAERVEIYNGTFQAGPTPGGGFGVHVTLPLNTRVGA